MIKISNEEFLQDLLTNRKIRIKIFNLGENIGMDFGYYCHFFCLKKAFPNVELHMIRTNLAECNSIGLGKYKNTCKPPLDILEEREVRQWYPDGSNWYERLLAGRTDLIPDYDYNMDGYDYYWGLGSGELPIWHQHFPENLKYITSSSVLAVIVNHNNKNKVFRELPTIEPPHQFNLLDCSPWSRTSLEHLCFMDDDYPVAWLDNSKKYSDYLRVGLRWPDYVRWYFSIEDQINLVKEVIASIKSTGNKVKIIYSLKDFELENNFNRGQTLEWLKFVNDNCDEALFTYSWCEVGMPDRPSEHEQLKKLFSVGITNIKRLTIWEDLQMCCNAKVYLSEPAGMAEVVYMARPHKESTFIFPTNQSHSGTLVVEDSQRRLVGLRCNPLVFAHLYKCQPIMSELDDPPHRLKSWRISWDDNMIEMPEDFPGGDFNWFQSLVPTVFKEFAQAVTAPLVDEIVKQYLRE